MTGAALPKDPRFPEPQKFLERACLAVVTLIAAVELAAWLAPSLGDHLPQAWSLMKANTAVGMLLAVVCLALSSIQATAWRLHLTALFGGLMVLLGSVVILEHGLDTSSFLDTLLAADTGSPRPGLMSAQSAFSFVILGLVLPLSGATRGVASFVADFLTLILVCLVLTAVLGAVYGVVRLIGQSAETRVSLQTLLCFILLTYVLIGRRTVGDTFSVLRGGAIGSRIARVAVPLVIFLPVALSMVHHYASTRGRISDPGGDALLVSFLCLSVACLVMFMAWHANALERRLRQLLGEQARQQLQESEQRYADLVEQSVFGILVRTQDRRILLANDTFCRLSGYTREELLHETREAFTRRVDPVAVAQAEALRPGESVRLQSQLRRKDGTMVPIEVFTLRLLNGNLQSTVEDVSERIQAERAQAESEQRYIDLIEQSIFGIIVRTPGRRILLVNDAFCRIKGSSREELLRLPPEDYAQTFDPSAVARVETLKPGESMRYEAQMKRTDGTQVTVEVVTLRLLNGNLQSTLKDITEHKQAERARTESEKRYFELVEQAIEGILVRKAGGELIFVNDTLCRMLGYSREELLRMSIRDLVDPADAATIEQVQRLNAGELLHLEKRLRHKSGREVHVEVSTRRQLGGDFQTTVQDVTARKLAERRFYTMVEGAPNAMLMVDAQGDITLVNRQTEELFGYTRAELVGQSIERLVPPRFRAQHPGLRVGFQREPQMRAMGAGRDLYALRKDGTEIPVEIGLNPVE
ncbi:MAG TPA: PAS domain S-box protein, partial [Gammaproteobacteria bacterium]|nr:PAS domain S-box protein [Gammaproteobacteria bacterium]